MSKSSGGTRGGAGTGTLDGGGDYTGGIKNVETLKNIQDPKLYKEMKAAISRYEAVLGVRQPKVKLADLKGAYGVHVTSGGVSEGVYLSKSHFKNATVKQIADEHKKNYKSGWSTTTNKAVAHTLTHELAHATWNSHLTSPKAQAAGKEIKKLYSSWKKDTTKKGWGKYATTNSSEFFAEGITKGIHGTSDKYTKALIGIVKKYKL